MMNFQKLTSKVKYYIVNSLNKVILFFLISSIVLPQSTGQLRGIVTDSLSSESLSFANVIIKELNAGSSTDEHGYYFIPALPANNYTLMISYVGYSTKTISIVVASNKITDVNIKLKPINIELQTIETVGQSIVEQNAPDIGLQKISIKKLESLPKGVETDIFRSLAYVPGINFTGDVSARYYVRGSDNNQNLILLNGTTIYNPFHALGLFSVIDPSMVKDIKLYKGGFPSEYGGRLSSVMDLITIDGNRNNYSATANVSLLTARAMVEGPIPNGSFVVTGRRSYNSSILKNFLNDKTVPFDFYDASAKLNYSNSDFMEGAKFVLHTFLSKDNLNNNNLLKEDFSWENNTMGFSWFQVYNIPLFSEYDFSISTFKGEVIPNFSNARAAKNELRDVTFKSNYNYLYNNKDEISFGSQITSFRTKLLLENDAGLFSELFEKRTNYSAYIKYKFLRFENFGVDVGARYNLVGISRKGDNYFEPRFSFTFKPFSELSIKGAWGMYQQEITTISDENEVISLFDPFVIVPSYLNTPKATHYSLGAELFISNNWKFSSEIYYKDLSNITAINPDKNFINDHDLISGDGESYGLEVFSTFVIGPNQFTASYTLSYAYKEENNWLYYPRYDSRHYLNLILETNLGKGWKTSLTWIYKTGLPFTQSVGFYEKLFLGDFRDDWDIYSNYIPFSILGDRSIGRLPNYHRMDITLSKELQIGFAKFYLDASIINLYDRKNIFYFNRSTGEQINMLSFLPTISIKVKI